MTPNEAIAWGKSLSKVTSVKHRNVLLRVSHGDIYTKAKLTRFGLNENPSCPRCDQVEDLKHKFLECPYARRIWSCVLQLTRSLKNDIPEENVSLEENEIIGATLATTPLILSIHGEVLNRILYLKDDANYLLHPKQIALMSIKSVLANERKLEIKDLCTNLLDRLRTD